MWTLRGNGGTATIPIRQDLEMGEGIEKLYISVRLTAAPDSTQPSALSTDSLIGNIIEKTEFKSDVDNQNLVSEYFGGNYNTDTYRVYVASDADPGTSVTSRTKIETWNTESVTYELEHSNYFTLDPFNYFAIDPSTGEISLSVDALNYIGA